MRTTVEIKPEHRAALLAAAARRGEKGFSSILELAVASFLDEEDSRERRRQELKSLAGSISREDAEALRKTTRELRRSWR